ncbi:MAG: phosphopantetheine adenylyltransferase [Candidatus Sericytochromatia bacterium]|nr:MAG: phosphopantetheine adenylyltransferase [Candidatus Sericytochromatia bacterium]
MRKNIIRGVYAGSFDPLTNGHLYIIKEASRIFDELIVSIGVNPTKKYTFSLEERINIIKKTTKNLKNIIVDSFENKFLIKYAEKMNCSYIVRGIRNESDYEFERIMRNINGDLNKNITTIFFMPPREIAEISSSFVKGLVGPEGWEQVVKKFVPGPVYELLIKNFSN